VSVRRRTNDRSAEVTAYVRKGQYIGPPGAQAPVFYGCGAGVRRSVRYRAKGEPLRYTLVRCNRRG
jgi:hypothetical protein